MEKRTAFTVLAVAAAAVALIASEGATGFARIHTEGVTLKADANFFPGSLPQRSFAPARISAAAGFGTGGAGTDRALKRMTISLGRRYVRIETRGLPVCRVGQLRDTTPRQARARCRGALVATGRATARAELAGGEFQASSHLSIFNGPPAGGRPTVISHAFTPLPERETFLVPSRLLVDRRGVGGFSIDVRMPEVASGRGYITKLSANIGRRYRHQGQVRSYISARCPASLIPAYGRFEFANGALIEGTLRKFCDFHR